MDIDSLILQIEEIDVKLSDIKKTRESLNSKLLELINEEVAKQLKEKEYGCGTANVYTQNHKVKVEIVKKVKWDQDKLSEYYKTIASQGDNPEEYIKVKYDVSENAYKNWPERLKNFFINARTVEPSTPKISFEKI